VTRSARRVHLHTLAVAAFLAATSFALYARSLGGPFVFDDLPSIVENPHVRALWPLASALAAPPQSSVAGRPLSAASFALSYAEFGLDPWGWRATNVALHALCALLLFGIVRRALGRDHGALAFAVALVWLVHPLQTEAVAYVTQRTELLMALAFLGAFSAAQCGFAAPGRRQRAWFGLAIAATWLGVGAKEAIASLPPLVLLYDRAFVSGSFGEALRRHRLLHVGLFASWLPLAALVVAGHRDQSVGFDLPIPAATYALTQASVICEYLRLALWPAPLVIAHDWPLATSLTDALPALAVLVPLLGGTLWACVRQPRLGFLGAWFFLTLAPTSSFVPIVSEIMAERRMYLPLAALVSGGALALAGLVRVRWARAAVAALCIAALAAVSAEQLERYRSTVTLWSHVIDVYPQHRLRSRIESTIAQELAAAGQLDAALPHFELACELRPTAPENWTNLGRARVRKNDFDGAIEAFERAAKAAPDDAQAHADLGLSLAIQRRFGEAQPELERAVALDPGQERARKALARVLVRLGEARVAKHELTEAIPLFKRATELDPSFQAAQQDLSSTALALAVEKKDAERAAAPPRSRAD